MTGSSPSNSPSGTAGGEPISGNVAEPWNRLAIVEPNLDDHRPLRFGLRMLLPLSLGDSERPSEVCGWGGLRKLGQCRKYRTRLCQLYGGGEPGEPAPSGTPTALDPTADLTVMNTSDRRSLSPGCARAEKRDDQAAARFGRLGWSRHSKPFPWQDVNRRQGPPGLIRTEGWCGWQPDATLCALVLRSIPPDRDFRPHPVMTGASRPRDPWAWPA